MSNDQTGLFIAAYNIGNGSAGGVNLQIHLAVNSVNKTVSGKAHLSQATSTPLDVTSSLHGTFSYMTVMPDNSHIQLRIVGYPEIKWPSYAGIGPVILPNLDIHMVLDDDWKTGSAGFAYLDTFGQWQHLENEKVELIKPSLPPTK